MAKNLQVNLAFTADTSAAMQNLQTLRNSLNEISSLPFSVGKGLSQDLQIASNSAQQLQKHLGAAMDVKTGNINLNKLQSSLQSSNQSLSQLTSGLLRAGTTGEQAFLATYSAIAQSNIQLKKSNTLLSQFALTMKNTAKWQLSSSLLHGLISGFNQAIDYAKDLNTSLNNIQIVTGQSSEQMAEFAKQANKAAKELRSTTVAYTDAALIYYQQGLSGKAVTDRADTTVKLANVTGESAETVSQWMTSVWNNFDDGSKSLEYYADVMTALGAATASSSDEIAQGLEKFAAVADTVGLSYESATAALATITATTRQSADVVGTALKTLFARIQDLDLGKTLEDGTTLGSYSEALNKVGINVKDQSGQLKEMDDIIDEMGAKWKTLDNDQQVALAKNVAGIRQYTQLIALMDNYDFYKQNQAIAAGAEGTLEQQAEIYEQSWEAASKNVKASLEGMYNVLIPKDFIVDFTNGLADVVSGFTEILDAAGGLRTILLLVARVAFTKFQTQIANAIDTGIQKTQLWIKDTKELVKAQGGLGEVINQKIGKSFQSEETARTQLASKSAVGIQAETQKGLSDALNQKDISGNYIPLSEGFVAQVKSLQQIEQNNVKILNLKNKMTEQDFEQLQLKQQQLKALGEENAANVQKISDLKLQLDLLKDQQNASFNNKSFESLSDNSSRVLSYDDTMSLNSEEQEGLRLATKAAAKPLGIEVGTGKDVAVEATATGGLIEFANLETAKSVQTEILEVVSKTKQAELEIQDIIKNQPSDQEKFKQSIQNTVAKLVKSKKLTEDQGTHLIENIGSYKNMTNLSNTLLKRIKGISSGAQAAAKTLKVSETAIKNSAENGANLYATTVKNNSVMGQTQQITQDIGQKIANIIKNGSSIGTLFTKGIQGANQFAMGLSMVTSSLKQIQEEGFSLSNISALLMGIGSTITSVAPLFSMLSGAIGTLSGQYLVLAAAKKLENAENLKGIQTAAANIITKSMEKELTEEDTKAKLANMLMKQAGLSTEEAAAAASAIFTSAKEAETVAEGVNTAGVWANTAAWYANPIMWIVVIIVAVIAALVALVAVFVNYNKQLAENRQQQIDNAKADLELIDKNQELAQSVSDLTKKYKELSDAGKSTYETMEELKKQIPDLIDDYRELENSLGIDLGIEGLQGAAETFEETGVVDPFIEEQKRIDAQIAAEEFKRAQTGARHASTKMVESAAAGDGKTTNNQYEVTIGGNNTLKTKSDARAPSDGIVEYNGKKYTEGEEVAASDILKDTMGEMWDADNNTIKFDLTNTQSIVEGYEKMAEARRVMESNFTPEQLAHTDTYRELVRELEEMSEGYQDVLELQGEVAAAAKDDFNANDGEKAKALFDSFGGEEQIESVENYMDVRDKLIEKLQQEYQITTAQAEALLGQSEVFSKFELAVDLFAEDGRIAEGLKTKGTLAVGEVQSWYDTLPEEDKTLFMGIDFSQVGSIEEAEKYLDGLREQADEQAAKTVISESAEKHGLDEEVLKKQAALLQDNVDGLENNAEAAAKMAIANQRLNKGVDTLTEGWEDWKKTLKSGDKTTQDYAEALVEVEGALKDILNLSDEEVIPEGFLESSDNLDLLDEIADGSEEAVEELAFNLAKAQIESKEFSAQIAKNMESAWDVGENADLEATFEDIKNGALSALSEIQTMANGLDIGAGLKDPAKQAELAAALNEYAMATGMTADEMQSMLNKVGVAAQIDMVEGNPVTKKIPIVHIRRRPVSTNLNTGEQVWEEDSTTVGYRTVTEPTLVPQIKLTGEGDDSSPTQPIFNKVSMGTISPSVTTSGKSSGGGGGGGGSSSKTATKEKKNLSEEGDFYHDINRKIDRLADTTDRLADAKDRAFGNDRLKAINREIGALQNEIKAQDELIDRADEKLRLDKEALKTYGATYNKNGEITNYDQMLQNEVNKYNAAVDKYNQMAAKKDAGDLTDKEWEAAEAEFEAAEERYNGFQEAVDEYEVDLDIKYDAVKDKAEKAREVLDLQLEGIQYGVDVQIEVNDYDLRVLEHLLDRLDDDKFDGVEKIKNMTSQMDEQLDNIEIYKAGIRQTLVSAGADQAALNAYMAGDSTAIQNLDLTEDQMNMLTEFTEGIMESEEAIFELRESIEGQVMATFEAWHEEIENNARAFEHATTMAQSYKDIIGLIGKGRLGNIDKAILKDLEATQQKSANAYMANAKVQMESTASALKQAQDSLANAVDDESREMWQGVVDELGVQLMEDQEAFMSSWNDALQTAADNFTAEMDRAFEDLEASLTGVFGSFDELSNYMEKQQSITDRYLNASEKTYELSKLNRKLQQDLDKTDSKKAQSELLAMQEEIAAYQASGVEMSERDLQALQKKYDLKLAEIALEEAQNAKSAVRLTQDSAGNFGYVYTADENKVADAQQNYEDALEANRQLAVDQQEELTSAIVDNRQKMVEALRAVRQEDYEDTAAYMAALEEVAAFYTEQEAYLINEYQNVVQRSQLIYEEDYMSYTGWSQAKSDYADQHYAELETAQSNAYSAMGQNAAGWVVAQSELMTQLGCDIMDGITNGDGSSGTNGLLKALGTVDDESGDSFFGAANAAAVGWQQATSTTLGLIGEDYNSLQASIQNAITGENGINDTIETNIAKLGTLSTTSKDEFEKATTEVNAWQKNYRKKLKKATTATNNLNKAIQDLTNKSIEAIAKVKGQTKVDKLKETINGLGDKTVNIKTNTTNTVTTENKTSGTVPKGTTPTSGTQGNGKPQVGDTVTFKSGVYTADSYGGGTTGSIGRGGTMKISLIASDTKSARPYHLTTTSGEARGWVSLDQIEGYDTGGYTGDWGPDGKLAFLHQKEIVLNADDTENLLKAVSMIRDISSKLEANALTMNQLTSLRANIGSIGATGQIVQQDVTIHAEFPNATNHNEIEEAFRNLSTLASQYTNRKI